MRLWSIHPSYLDSIGLVALWCENLAAKKVLEGKTKGYIHHPQWVRFRITKYPVAAINATFAFAPPRNPPPLAKAKEPFICTIIKIMFHITAVRFILTYLLQVII
ncbi:MAG: pyrimidine dimer DNA glycosylase/endonuclease V [Bacteroidales bacterium]|nr:pyrimidine dimer DNA glycosylase/endonuclease V [Bacteroidales bacterium]